MIQRIQTVFLALLLVVMLLTHFIDFAAFNVGEAIFNFDIYCLFKFTASEEIKLNSHWYLAIISLLIQLVALATIVLFKNRALQIKLCKLNFLLISAFIALLFLAYGKYQTIAQDYAKTIADAVVNVQYRFALVLPFLGLFFNFLALRFIKKDEELIRSADRIR
ncbi:MAG: DUF4293 domain-containing protein [Bacteroidota bacterium]